MQFVRVEERGSTLEITLDRPPANAITPAVGLELHAAYRRLRDDPGLRVGILTGAGERIFCAGWDMKEVAAERVADLQRRGYQHAGLYDPQGVGGTHVMYVLHHADKPEQYSGLPGNPEISPTVQLWKGLLKPLATIGIAAAGLFGFLHYITIGPNRADGDEETETREEDKR